MWSVTVCFSIRVSLITKTKHTLTSSRMNRTSPLSHLCSSVCLSVFQVDKVCGHSSNTSSSTVGTFPPIPVTPPPANISQDVPRADKIGVLAHLHRLGWIPSSVTKTYLFKINIIYCLPYHLQIISQLPFFLNSPILNFTCFECCIVKRDGTF